MVRDVLVSFWSEFFNSLAIGALEKVPNIRHDHQKTEWEAIGRIIVYGYEVAGYFPLGLSRAFVAAMLFGEDSLTSEFLVESFKLYVSSDDREVVIKALGPEFNPNDEDLLDFLSTYKAYKIPAHGNIKEIMQELAHQEIIQKPRYIVDCLTPVVSCLRSLPSFRTLSALEDMYSAKQPSAKKIIKLLSAKPDSPGEHESFDHFKRFIRHLEGKALAEFLQFVTGSDVIICDSIAVTFLQVDGVARRPVIHTCGPSVELPSTYQSYNELAEEFNALLREREAWVFNIA